MDIIQVVEKTTAPNPTSRVHLSQALVNLFLPSGYPHSVTPDYLHFQVLNALQAFCSSVSGLISSRAILEGSGVGNASASATHALLVNIVQDIFSRLTTIIAAYYIGTSLFPEAKTYRIIADITNDLAIVLDVLSPLLTSVSFSLGVFSPRFGSLRVVALCLSGSFRSLCGIAAGGSRSAMSAHFSTPATGRGDLGDLSAKESSLETVLCLFGMLSGTLIIPYLTTPWLTYTVLFTLLLLHLTTNYFAVRGIAFRTLNRQRTTIAWSKYRQSPSQTPPSPAQVAAAERILEWPGTLRDARTGIPIGHCTIGSSLSITRRTPLPPALLALFLSERYILCPADPPSSSTHPIFRSPPPLQLHIFLKEHYTPSDLLKAWLHAVEVSLLFSHSTDESHTDTIRIAYRTITDNLSAFVDGMRAAGWDTDGRGILAGAPKTVLVSATDANTNAARFTHNTNGDKQAMEAKKKS